jgi:Uma2 family endonuclease
MQPARSQRRQIGLRYQVDPYPPSWFIEDDEKVPESRPHSLVADHIASLLLGWKERSGRDVQVGKDLAIRWDEDVPQVGVDPDVYIVEPPPPEGDDVTSLRTWVTGHHPPLLAIEIVSRSRPDKDYSSSPLKYAANGTRELWVFDPFLAGPRMQGGPFRLQQWQRDEQGELVRVYAGEGPIRSDVLDAWVFAVDEGRSIAIADDADGTHWWLTAVEKARADADRERRAKEAALQRVAELEALLKAKT